MKKRKINERANRRRNNIEHKLRDRLTDEVKCLAKLALENFLINGDNFLISNWVKLAESGGKVDETYEELNMSMYIIDEKIIFLEP